MLSDIDLATEKDRQADGLAEFVRGGWHVLEPGRPLVWNWHLDVLCAYLEAVQRGDITYLIINIPPGTMKSLVIGVFYPAWVWIHDPSHRFLAGTNDTSLAGRDATRQRTLVQSHWYQSKWGYRIDAAGQKVPLVRISASQSAARLFLTTAQGHRESLSFGEKVTGKRGDTQIIDDPHDANQTESPEQRQGIVDRYTTGWVTRVNDQDKSARILVMQRLHVKDMTAKWLEIYPSAVHLRIPMRYEKEVGPGYDAGRDIGRPDLDDPRREDGELMFPALFSEAAVRTMEAVLGPYGTAGQLQQRPNPRGGGEFERGWIMHWQMPPRGGNRYVLVDPAGERKLDNLGKKRDNSAILVVEAGGDQNMYVVDAYRDRLDLVERTKLLFELHRKYRPLGVGYEATGFDSDIAHIRERQEMIGYRFKVTPLRATVEGRDHEGKRIKRSISKKEDRIRRLLPWFKESRLWLPEAIYRTNYEGKTVDIIQQFIEQEYLPFPVAEFDDLFDCLSRICDDDMQIQFPSSPRLPPGIGTQHMRDPSTGY